MMHEIELNRTDALRALQAYIRWMATFDDHAGFFAKPEWAKRESRPVQAWEVSGYGYKATVYLFEFTEPRWIGSTLQTGFALASAPWSVPFHWFGGDCNLPLTLAAREVLSCGCA